MPHINIETKAKSSTLAHQEQKLLTLEPLFMGTDHQIDTYFNTPNGRLKMREGNIENSLIYYERPDMAGSKQSNILLYDHLQDDNLKAILSKVLGIKAVVDKIRKIYFIQNVKFHFDEVRSLGSFIEIEAIDKDGRYSVDELRQQCDFYKDFLGIHPSNEISASYSDLLLARDE